MMRSRSAVLVLLYALHCNSLARKFASPDARVGRTNGVKRQAATLSRAPNEAGDATSTPTVRYALRINEAFPGLRRVVADPPIYFVRDFLSDDECDALAAKATQERLSWGGDSTGRVDRRTSKECRLGYDEVAGIQRRCADLLAMPTSHLEPLKLTRYGRGDHFSYHHDADRYGGYPGGASNCATAHCNRVATIVLYLNECEGGEMVFRNLLFRGEPLAFPPRKGAAVIHFPANAADARVPLDVRGRYDPRVGHEGAPVVAGEKLICQQWAWTGPLDRYNAPFGYRQDRWPWRGDPGAAPL